MMKKLDVKKEKNLNQKKTKEKKSKEKKDRKDTTRQHVTEQLKNTKKPKKKGKLIILVALFLLLIVNFSFSLSKIFVWKKENKEIEKQVEKIHTETEITETEDTEQTEVIEPVVEIPKEDPYWDYIKMNLIHVDFNELKKTNNQTVGWIQVNGTNINYPFVQTSNNDYYLSHAFNKSYNSAGWVFMDYRNNPSEFDKNTILYAHGRLDNTMFGSLKKIITSGWFHNSNNYIVKLSTEYENTLWQVFSVYRIPTTNDYLQIYFDTGEEFTSFANMLMARSSHNFNTAIDENDKILTLSTCYDDNDKVVLHAKLIKREAR